MANAEISGYINWLHQRLETLKPFLVADGPADEEDEAARMSEAAERTLDELATALDGALNYWMYRNTNTSPHHPV